jgi:hypothetical protein
MRRLLHAMLGVGLAAFLGCAQSPDRNVDIPVPAEVARGAAPPILVLEGVELGQDEGITIQVLAGRTVLGSAAMVGAKQSRPHPPLVIHTLIVPLNDRAREVLAGKSQVSLTLRVDAGPGRPALKLGRIYFRSKGQ